MIRSAPMPDDDVWTVRWIGAQRDVLAGDLSGKIDLRTLADVPHLYALGPCEGLQGEVTVFDGRPSIARVVAGRIEVDARLDHHACFLVFASVPGWDEVVLTRPIRGVPTLEEEVVKASTSARARLPLPFRVTGRAEHAMLHVLDKRDGLPHTPELHERAKVHFAVEQKAVEIIGFLSSQHRGIFTPKDANLHMHIRTLDDRTSGHLETVELAAGASLWLPHSRGGKGDGV
ncbi:MAG TPA: hypothetical protein VMS64_32555 [Candidatus Methylomirabilis sp.]|nr:hypothetical protein [Candidatus Methylomirabilis sp.]